MSRRYSSSPQRRHRGGANRCSGNNRYQCNYGNIKRGFCPGYIARRVSDIRPYPMIWEDDGAATDIRVPQGHNFSSQAALQYTTNGARGNTSRGTNTQCLPRNAQGQLYAGDSSRNPNKYCRRYRSRRHRQQRGCVDRERARRRQRSRSRSRSRTRSRSRSRSRPQRRRRSQSPPPPLRSPPSQISKRDQLKRLEADIQRAYSKAKDNKQVEDFYVEFWDYPLIEGVDGKLEQLSENDITDEDLNALHLIVLNAQRHAGTESSSSTATSASIDMDAALADAADLFEQQHPAEIEPGAINNQALVNDEGFINENLSNAELRNLLFTIDPDGEGLLPSVAGSPFPFSPLGSFPASLLNSPRASRLGSPSRDQGGGGNEKLKALLLNADKNGKIYYLKGKSVFSKMPNSKGKKVNRADIPADVAKQLREMEAKYDRTSPKKIITANFVNQIDVHGANPIVRMWHPIDQFYFYLMNEDGFDVRLVRKGGKKMLGLVATETIKPRTKIPYLGKPLTAKEQRSEEKSNNFYLMNAEPMGRRITAIDGSPMVAKDRNSKSGEYWTISPAQFANEPSPGEEVNAVLLNHGMKGKYKSKSVEIPTLEITSELKAGDEVLVCYGKEWEGNYPVDKSCR